MTTDHEKAKATHTELIAVAARWLRGTRRCALVATERRCWKEAESPDAIGWLSDGVSVLVECKTSRADFLADQHKPHRGDSGMGRERWYLAEDGVLQPEDMPGGWGLIVLRRGRVFRVVHAELRPDLAVRAELSLMVAIARRAIEGHALGVTVADANMEAA